MVPQHPVLPDGGFRTPDGRAVPTMTADEMRAVDRVAVVLAEDSIPAAVFRRAGVDYASPFDGRYRVPLSRTSDRRE